MRLATASGSSYMGRWPAFLSTTHSASGSTLRQCSEYPDMGSSRSLSPHTRRIGQVRAKGSVRGWVRKRRDHVCKGCAAPGRFDEEGGGEPGEVLGLPATSLRNTRFAKPIEP